MSTKIVVPELSESVSEATVGRWLKGEGDAVEEGEALVELETDKVDLEVGAESAGVLAKVEKKPGDTVAPGDVLGLIEPNGAGGRAPEAAGEEAASPPANEEAAAASEEREDEHDDDVKVQDARARAPSSVSPMARRIAEEEKIDLSEIEGSGRGGRIVKADVERARERKGEPREREPARESRPRETRETREPSETRREARPEERHRLSTRRRTIARKLAEAQRQAAILTTFNDVDMSATLALRKRYGDEFEKKHGVRLGITSFFVKATVHALRAFPELNSELSGDELVLKRYYDVGIAVADPKGLVVPVLRNCDRMSLADVERAIDDLASRARSGELGIEELEGGTFTITNGGIFGSLMSTPILNPPQVGILGLHRIEERPVGREGRVELRPMMYLALSYDHRVIDGSEAVRFLDHVKRLVERPETFVLES